MDELTGVKVLDAVQGASKAFDGAALGPAVVIALPASESKGAVAAGWLGDVHHVVPDPITVIQQPRGGAYCLAEAAAQVVNTFLQLSVGFGPVLGVARKVEVVGVVTVCFGTLGGWVECVGGANSTVAAGSRDGNAHDIDVEAGELVERAWLEADAV